MSQQNSARPLGSANTLGTRNRSWRYNNNAFGGNNNANSRPGPAMHVVANVRPTRAKNVATWHHIKKGQLYYKIVPVNRRGSPSTHRRGKPIVATQPTLDNLIKLFRITRDPREVNFEGTHYQRHRTFNPATNKRVQSFKWFKDPISQMVILSKNITPYYQIGLKKLRHRRVAKRYPGMGPLYTVKSPKRRASSS